MKIILISGKAQHGKDTFASMLKQDLEAEGQRVLISHFGDLLKYIYKTFYGWDGDKSNPEGRAGLQRLGTDVIRKHIPNYWCDFVKFWADHVCDLYDFMIIPDVRFENEIRVFSDYDCTKIKIQRVGDLSDTAIANMNHASETSLDNYTDWDYTIVNHTGEIGKLRNKSYLLSKELTEGEN